MLPARKPMSASVTDIIKTYSLYVLPQHALTRIVFWLTRQRSFLTTPVVKWFAGTFNVDMRDAVNSDLHSYATFNEFFTRALKPDARPIAHDIEDIACPADGKISAIGKIEGERIFQAKGIDYSLLTLLGGDSAAAQKLKNGRFTTIYLSPRDYHRLHMPLAGRLIKQTYVPGRLYSVGPHTVRVLPGLFTRNERVIAQFETHYGLMALVLVGAMNVAAIETVWHGLVTPPHKQAVQHTLYHAQESGSSSIDLEKGAEMGRFNMGSTIIVLLENPALWSTELQSDDTVLMGQGIGKVG